ncbi:DUF3107 domain-containing protein [Bifidobacterium xylocopae]|uniref:ATP-binding protein n=1 Tax=Bifidobacterium xylocopae TaxID=2493119 RepID=A0A366KD78_9BIFI|nr:DUF3107 domain-containing protein [Bifidobacterium xylocopae]RBP99063.1 ATP-binding protein [Bifidobacterium xylocopae]
MDIEFGIRNVARPVSFSTDASADETAAKIQAALKEGGSIDLVDGKGRRIIVPSDALGYAIVGSDTARPVGFGSL